LDHLATLQEVLNRPPQEIAKDLETIRQELFAASEDMATLRAETEFLDPLLSHLGWIPRYGPELAAIPHLTEMAANLSEAGADLVNVTSELLPILEEGPEDGLAQAIEILQQRRPVLQVTYARLQRAAYERTFLNTSQLDDGPFTRVGPLLETLDTALPTALRALGMLNALLPQADILLGMEGPQRYLILGQNNFELRATGGFMGSMGVVTVQDGRIVNLDYRRSYDWDNPNREKVQPPLPYVRYMRFGAWYIRDANWYADFPSTAQTVQMFWELDGQNPVAGVIALDLHLVESLITNIGPIPVPGYGISIGGTDTLETIWEEYRQDPGFLPALTAAVAIRLQQPTTYEPARLPNLLQAVGTALEEKHLLLYSNDPSLQQAFTRAGWDGAIRSDLGDFLMVVDSDFSYAEVNPFIEEDLHYRVTLDHSLRVQESAITITYWNRFDRWASAETKEHFGGLCFDPETEDLAPIQGCYGNYIRLFVPRGSQFVSASGFDDGMEYREEAGRTVIAGYVRILPGEQRTVSVTYTPPVGPVGGQYRLTLQKQPGTDALPMEIEIGIVGSDPIQEILRLDLRTDRVITAMWQGEKLLLSGEQALLGQLDPEQRARQQALTTGMALWESGEREAAVTHWDEGDAADLVLERASLMQVRGDLEEAEALCRSVLEIAPDPARAYFILGEILYEAGDIEAARQSWEQAVELDPENRFARLELGLLYEELGQPELAGEHLILADGEEIIPILWQRARQHFNDGKDEEGLDTLQLIVEIAPQNTTAHLALASQLSRLERYEDALVVYEQVQRIAPEDVRLYIGRGQLYAIQQQGDEAIAELETAVSLAPRSAEAWFYLGSYRWQFLRDAGAAIAAIEQAISLNATAGYALGLGNVYWGSGETEAAIQAYERSVTLPGQNSHTWLNLGHAYEHLELWEEAISTYSRALALYPESGQLHAALAYAYAENGQIKEAISEYEAALDLEPGQEEWQQALNHLRE
jgi:tetratricopeptide (TPR) repeat protein